MGTQGNEENDRLAKEGSNQEILEPIDLQIPTNFSIQGAKLATINQATAYRGILEKKHKQLRPEATRNLETTRIAIEEISGTKETNTTIWKGTRKTTLRTRVQQVLYKTIHKAYMIGDKWTGIFNYKEHAHCQNCNRTESMQHILLECESQT